MFGKSNTKLRPMFLFFTHPIFNQIMKKILLLLSLTVAAFSFNACNRAVSNADSPVTISDEVKHRIEHLGFSSENVVIEANGYIVEGDIFLSNEDLAKDADLHSLHVGDVEQYNTTYLVTGLPRVITVSVSSLLPASYPAAVDEAIARYNAQNLQITFTRVASGGNINIVRGNGSYLASAGFPTSAGNPHNEVKVNSKSIGSNPNQAYLATILAHEMGHCVGFRHTDYMDRSYSCGGATTNEGASTVGAIHIPGTPTTADPGSWMLACIGSGQNRPFNNNDITALNYLY